MSQPRPVALVVAASLALLAGCGGGGGSGRSSSSLSQSQTGSSTGGGTLGGSSTGGGSTTGGAQGTGSAFAVTSPNRGDFLSGAAQITVSGTTASNVAQVQVNGQTATISGGTWSIPATLAFGVNIFAASATDASGNDVGHTSFSVVYAQSYVSPAQDIEDALAMRVSQNALSKIVPLAVSTLNQSGALAAAVQQAAGAGVGGLTISQLNFGTPSVTVTLVQGGFDTTIDVQNVAVDATFAGTNFQFSATDARIDATLDVSVANGAFVVTMPTPPSVVLTGYSSSLPLPVTIVEVALATAMQTALPPAVETALNGALKSYSATYGPLTLTVDAKPRSLAIDPTQAVGAADANVTVAVAGATPMTTAPGAPSRGGATTTPPSFTTPHDLSFAIREDTLNRALFAAWQSGGMHIQIDQAWLTAHGVNLPVPLDASFLVPFFPALANLKPGGGPMPIAFEFGPALPPMVSLTGTPSLMTSEIGELQVGVLIDLGQGFVPLLALSAQAELGTTVAISNNALQVTIGQPTQIYADLVGNPLGLSAPDIDRFLQAALPMVLQLAGGMIPPIPLPAVPGGLQPTNVDIRVDGPAADFLTVEGDL
jgi:hypothetical protein